MRNSNRNAKALAVLSAAAGLAASVQLASAQTWVNPNTGNWSVGANWVGGLAPVGSPVTALTFNATGAQSYTATNNLGAFQFGTLNFNNTGTGTITIAGNDLVPMLQGTGGTMPAANVNLTGNGPVSITAPITGNGTSNTFKQQGGNLFLSGGTGAGGLYALSQGTGNTTVTGGTWTLTSTDRRQDPIGANSGEWSLNIGEAAGVSNFTQTGGVINGQQGMASIDGGNTSTWTVTGATTEANFAYQVDTSTGGRFGIMVGSGTINVLAGGRMSGRLFEVGRDSAPSGGVQTYTVNVSGTNSRILAHQLITRASGTANINISAGGLISLTEASAAAANGAGLLGIGGSTTGTLQEAAPGTCTMNITGTGSQFRAIQPQIASELGVATVNITAGGKMLANPSPTPATLGEAIFMGDADALGDPNDTSTSFGAINVDGPGSELNNSTTSGAVIVMGGGGGAAVGGDALLNVSNGASATSNDLTIGQDAGSNGTVNVNGASSTINIIPNGAGTIGSIVMAGNRDTNGTATGVLNINAGTVSTGNTFIGGGFADALGDPVDGGNATVTVATGGRLNVSNQFTMASVPQGNGTMNVNGGVVTTGGSAFLSPTDEIGSGSAGTATSLVNVNGGSWTIAGQLQVGGAGTLEGAAATVNVTNNGFVSANGGTSSLIAVFSPGVINVGSGTSKGTLVAGTLGTLVDGTINFNAGTFNSVGTLDVAGRVLLSSAARNGAGTPSNKKLLEAGSATLTSSGLIDLNDNDALFHSGTRQQYETFVRNARNNGLWNGNGITSTAAKNSVPQNKNLGVLSGAEYLAANGAPFNGKTVVAGDTVIKFTFNGDTDLNGVVNFDDYSRVDSGFNNGRSGWLNGDFDYNGVINFDDYSLIDQGFNTQGATVLSSGNGAPAGPSSFTLVSTLDGKTFIEGTSADPNHMSYKYGVTGEGNGNLQAVPEPGTLSLIGLGMLGALRRRRRSAR